MIEARALFVYCILSCIGIMVAYSFLIYFMTMPFVWISILATGAGIIGLSYLLNHYVNMKYSGISSFVDNLQSEEPNWTALALKSSVGLLWLFATIYFCCVFCHIADIRISVLVLATSAKVMLKNLYLILIPVISSLFVLAWFAWWSYNFMYLLSTGSITQPTNGSQLKRVTLGEETTGLAVAQVLVGIWVYELIQAFHNYIIICGVCTWYFTSSQDSQGHFSLAKGLKWAALYNFGSLAFGSLILSIVWCFRVLFDYASRKLEEPSNILTKCCAACCSCCLTCFHSFIKFLDENAYVQVALTSDSLCTAAYSAYCLALKSSSSFFITAGIGYVMRFFGRVSICITNTLIGYVIIYNVADLGEDIDNPIVILALIFLISFALSSIFMDVYAIVSLSIFQCLYTDMDISRQQHQ